MQSSINGWNYHLFKTTDAAYHLTYRTRGAETCASTSRTAITHSHE
ncbi:hypothetical protein PAE4_10439 [Bacillus altitudinis]|uniref:Uncharacterized protein n=1 Tax=Bacillus altitudinis TaxID=293387 RepID=A0A653XC89_BACAB|nr:hypothetical protein PAE4_10439 [Bacillus altitudinis]VXC26113.1 hypothetical protein BACI348_50679 [Bacillus altitudinis]